MSNTFRYLLVLGALLISGNAEAAPSQRIVSLKPNITEIVFALGAGDRIVGVTTYCDTPEEARTKPVVADYVQPFVERVIAQRPDIVLGSRENSNPQAVEQLQRLGIRVELYSFDSIAELQHSIRSIGNAIGEKKAGEQLVEKIEQEIQKLKRLARTASVRPSALVVWGQRPLIVAGRSSAMHEMLLLAGLNNAVESNLSYPRWSQENLIAADPDVILDLSMNAPAEYPPQLRAVQAGKVYPLDPQLFRMGPRIGNAVQQLAENIR